MQTDVHRHFQQAAVEIVQEAPFQAEIGLRSREQILHDAGEPRAAARELHHARRHTAEQEASEEHALGQPRAELQISRKITPQHAPVGLTGQFADL